mmetsp:Transcript_67846/g.141821  ORF Transcript_67846/g.141821 Transcript_67846/m.141821 type:complete len:203 (+) Transcript_67846:638-1246(+)
MVSGPDGGRIVGCQIGTVRNATEWEMGLQGLRRLAPRKGRCRQKPRSDGAAKGPQRDAHQRRGHTSDLQDLRVFLARRRCHELPQYYIGGKESGTAPGADVASIDVGGASKCPSLHPESQPQAEAQHERLTIASCSLGLEAACLRHVSSYHEECGKCARQIASSPLSGLSSSDPSFHRHSLSRRLFFVFSKLHFFRMQRRRP